MGYTLKLDLTDHQHNVLCELLNNDQRRSEREGTTDSPWATAVAEISDQISGYREALEMARKLDGQP